MPLLNITKLECIKKRDPVGKSEFDIYVSVDYGTEVFLSGPHMMDNSKNDDEVRTQRREVLHRRDPDQAQGTRRRPRWHQ